MNFKDLKIGTRLAAAFSAILIMLVAVAGLGISRMSLIEDAMTTITHANNVEQNMATAMKSTVADRMIAVRNVVLLTDPAAMQPEADRIKAQAQMYDDAETKLRSAFATFGMIDEERTLLAAIKDDSAAVQPLIEKATALGLANQNTEAIKILTGNLLSAQKKWIDDLSALEASEQRQNEEATVAAAATYLSARNMVLTLSGLAVLFGVVLAWSITRSITTPINYAVAIAQTVASGDLTSKIEVTSKDETGSLLAALKAMNDSLKIIVGQVRAGTDTMSTASQQIAAGNLDLSSRTEEQASSLEETASSMEQLTSTVKQNSDNAIQANSLAATASDIASKGGSVVSLVVDTMGAINESSKKIVDIINVIDGIAFQTNILALNAAVEAARAGEQGRGFAVVATEVRNLAHRSAAAAKEIKELIGDSVGKVEAGAKLVDEAGETMSQVVDSVRRVSDIIAEITSAGKEQVLGIEQINQAIIQMDTVTQQNAALVEESAAAAESLQDQAMTLTQVVSKFVLDQTYVSTVETKRIRKPYTGDTASRSLARPAPKLSNPANPTPITRKSATTTSTGQGEWEEF